jgi:Helix-turn-helix domain
MSQRHKVLSLLRHAGESGVTNAVFLDWRIPRFSARIKELRDEGYEIRTEGQTNSRVRYTLLSEPDVERTASSPPDQPANAPHSAPATDVWSHVGSKSGVVSGETGPITRVSASGSLDAGRLFDPPEPKRPGHYEDIAA